VDERIAPPGHPDRNLTHLSERLLAHALDPSRLHAMPAGRVRADRARLLADVAAAAALPSR